MFKYISCIALVLSVACGNSQGTETGPTGGNGFVVHHTGGNGGMSAGGGSACAQQQVPLKVIPPDILIIQDRSGSMADNANDQTCPGGCGVNSKWTLVTTAIENVVNATQTSVNWGLFYFGSGTSTCGVNTNPAVPVALGSGPAIQTSLAATAPSGGTPTRVTINNAVAYMKTLTDTNPKYLLLATDGEPNCVNGSTNISDATATIAAITTANTAGYPTFVVGIGNVTASTATLNSMAVAGGEAQTGTTSYYAVADTASLEAALTKIVGMVASCVVPLDNVPSGQWSIAIFVTDATGKVIEVANNQTDGWFYTDTAKSSVTLVGTTCDNVKNGVYSNLQFVYTCQGQVINPPA